MQGLTRDDLVQRLLDFDEEMFLRYRGVNEYERRAGHAAINLCRIRQTICISTFSLKRNSGFPTDS